MSAGALAITPRPVASVAARIRGLSSATLAVVGLTFLAALLRFTGLGQQGLWWDEAYTSMLVHLSPGKMLGKIPLTELTPPFYYCVAWVWAHIFGFGEVGLRSLSALAGVLTIPVMYGAATKLISRRAGLIAAALASCNPLLIWYSQEARSYSLLVFLATLSLLAFAYARSEPTTRTLGAWALAAALTITTHYFSVLAIVPQAIWLLVSHRRERKVLVAVAAVGACGLALLPLALSQQPQASWIAGWPLDRRIAQMLPQLLLGTGAPARSVLKLAGLLAVLLAALMLARRADTLERRGARVAGGLLVLGILLNPVLLLGGVDELITRNLIVLLIPLLVLVAAGLGARRAGVLGLVGVGTLCVIGVTAAIGVALTRDLQRTDWRPVARAIGARPPAGAGRAILIQRYRSMVPLFLYMPGLRYLKPHQGLVNELDVISISDSHGWFCWWGSACNTPPSTLDTSVRVPGFRRVGSVIHANRFSILRLRAVTGPPLTTHALAHSLTRRRLRSDGLIFQAPA